MKTTKTSNNYTNDPHLKDFLSFLREHNALVPFIVNLFTVSPIISTPKYKSINHWWELTDKDRPIIKSFTWCYTHEGFKYWHDISHLWYWKL